MKFVSHGGIQVTFQKHPPRCCRGRRGLPLTQTAQEGPMWEPPAGPQEVPGTGLGRPPPLPGASRGARGGRGILPEHRVRALWRFLGDKAGVAHSGVPRNPGASLEHSLLLSPHPQHCRVPAMLDPRDVAGRGSCPHPHPRESSEAPAGGRRGTEVLGLSPALRPFCLGELAPPCPQAASSSASGSTGSGVGAARALTPAPVSAGLPDQGVVGSALRGQRALAAGPVHAGLPAALHGPHLLQVPAWLRVGAGGWGPGGPDLPSQAPSLGGPHCCH